MACAVDMKGITVRFGEVIANNAVDFKADWGEVHGLVGENGAGKTTLMRVLYGMYTPQEGQLAIEGEPVRFSGPKDAISRGIGMVHQHFSLVPTMTVAENIVIGKPPLKMGLLHTSRSREIVRQLSEQYGLEINPDAYIRDLPVGLQQRVEILKALYLGADILIMDEPTAVLTPQEIRQLIETLISLKEKNKCIILITHKLAEVKAATDRITVMRAGRVTARVNTGETDERRVAKMMVGREVLLQVEKQAFRPGEVILDVQELSCNDKMRLPAVRGVSFQVHSGEVVGIAGVQGNGQSELADAISGLIRTTGGTVRMNGQELGRGNVSLQCRTAGMAHIHDDRTHVGAALTASIRDNFLAPLYRRGEFSGGALMRYKKGEEVVAEQIEKYAVKVGKISDEISSLSGGNMQKLIVARELYPHPKLLIASQPTRGVDIGAQEFIYKRIIEQRDRGNAVLLISNELSEILTLSDRILVIFKGEIIGEMPAEEATEEKLGFLMAGIRSDEKQEEAKYEY